ncbi:MAG TPA: protein YibB [Enterobacteriaceae bacterium]|nr:protein YibB [Enterobacteriaceae bacterium]
MDSSITIVTAFFDIGRGSWTSDKGFSPYLERASDTYLEYFKNLAALDNEMVIFTSSDLKSRVEEIRKGKRTTVIAFEFKHKFKHIRNKIDKIQKSDDFRNRLEKRQLQNPEYWSADYVLVCNLKSYFVKKAIDAQLVSNEMVAWVDFGYCRTPSVTAGLSQWNYPFNKNKVNMFTIKRGLRATTLDRVFDCMINNRSFIIGGAVVATKEKWSDFYKLVLKCQWFTLKNNVVDDDQGIFIMSKYYCPDLIKLNYMGKNRWFNLFRLFGKNDLKSFLLRVKVTLFRK